MTRDQWIEAYIEGFMASSAGSVRAMYFDWKWDDREERIQCATEKFRKNAEDLAQEAWKTRTESS